MPAIPTAPVVAAGLIGGFALAQKTRREIGGAAFVAAGAFCARSWRKSASPAVTAGLLGTYVAAMGGSHPLAKKIGAWPAVVAVSGVASGAAYALADRRRRTA